MSTSNDRQQNARKWTVEIVTQHLQQIEKETENERCFFLGRILVRRRLYPQVWTYWKQSFRDNDDIIERMMRIETTLEANMIEAALRNELPARFAAMSMKFNYGWNNKGQARQASLLNKKASRLELLNSIIHKTK